MSDQQKKDETLTKPKVWNHQDELKAAIGKKITIWPIPFNANPVIPANGELLAVDESAIKVRNRGGTRVLFKHAIGCYEIHE